jgi:adenine-specific DNA-methyltransferase
MDRMRMESEDIQQENVKKVAAMFPNCVTEARDEDGHLKKAINFELLKQMLSDSVIDGDEAYEFTWVGKKASIVEANRPIRKTLRPVKADSVHWDTTENLYIEGDNLEVLKLLQESYLGKVKMIYIDPPYNTGHDFVYPDSFIMDNEDYNEGTGYFDEDGNVNYRRENSASAGKYHSDWCSMIYSRLMLARNLLTNDGIIFISIDDNEITNLRKICEEVFGEQNFVAQISLLCNPKGRSQDKYVASCHEYVLIYSNSVLPAGSVSIPKNDDEISKDYSLFDEKGKPYRELELRNTHRDFGKFNRPKMWYPIYVDKDGSVSLDKSQTAEAVYPIWDDGFEGCWTWGIEKAQNEINLLVAKKVNGKTKIYRKAYAYEGGDRPLKQVKSIWNDKRFFTEKGQISFNELLQTKGKLFQSPKSVSMVEQCIQMCQSSEDIVMDFFSGSGTTAHAVMQLNAEDGGHRKFIMVQLPEETDEKSEAFKAGYRNICEIGKERIRRAAKEDSRG